MFSFNLDSQLHSEFTSTSLSFIALGLERSYLDCFQEGLGSNSYEQTQDQVSLCSAQCRIPLSHIPAATQLGNSWRPRINRRLRKTLKHINDTWGQGREFGLLQCYVLAKQALPLAIFVNEVLHKQKQPFIYALYTGCSHEGLRKSRHSVQGL